MFYTINPTHTHTHTDTHSLLFVIFVKVGKTRNEKAKQNETRKKLDRFERMNE